jgi:hypothetical protein
MEISIYLPLGVHGLFETTIFSRINLLTRACPSWPQDEEKLSAAISGLAKHYTLINYF